MSIDSLGSIVFMDQSRSIVPYATTRLVGHDSGMEKGDSADSMCYDIALLFTSVLVADDYK